LDGIERFVVLFGIDDGGGNEKFIGGNRLKNGGYGLFDAVCGIRIDLSLVIGL
jgi:hypothetical protein